MQQLKEVYNLRNDTMTIKAVREASLDKNSFHGFKIENGLLFGTDDWFNAIEANVIKKRAVRGVISKVYMTGHNDFPEFEIQNSQGKSTWERMGDDQFYVVGRDVELTLVEQKTKRGVVSQCILQIKIGE